LKDKIIWNGKNNEFSQMILRRIKRYFTDKNGHHFLMYCQSMSNLISESIKYVEWLADVHAPGT
jgi:hypothetical protein